MSERPAQANSAAPALRMEGRLGLRTLILIRWIAVAGQTVTILVVHIGFEFSLPLAACARSAPLQRARAPARSSRV